MCEEFTPKTKKKVPERVVGRQSENRESLFLAFRCHIQGGLTAILREPAILLLFKRFA